MNRSKLKQKLTAILLLLLIAIGAAPIASAEYYISSDGTYARSIPTVFQVDRIIGNFAGDAALNTPSDLFIDSSGNIYILDSGEGKIVVLNAKEQVQRVINGTYGASNLPLSAPQGIFVDSIGDIFIADTGNARVVHLTSDGTFVEEFVQPTEDTYDTSYPFKPTKVVVDNKGRLYVLNDFDWHGIIVLDPDNHFLGYLSSSRITSGFMDWLIRIFATEAQKEQLARETPPYFSNLMIDKDNMLYTTSFWADSQELKKLTVSGVNIYPAKVYGEANGKTNFNYRAGFVDITATSDGLIYAADMVTGKIYVYDQEGNNLAVFGGEGRRKGRFDTIAAIGLNPAGELMVLDGVTGLIQVFQSTELMDNIILATTLYNQGKYEEAQEPWQNVLELDSTNDLANIGLAKAEYRRGNYTEAMELYENAYDKAGYSTAFSDYRLSLIRQYFTPLVIGVLVFAVLVFFLIARLKRYADRAAAQVAAVPGRIGWRGYLRIGVMTIFHPIDAFYVIKVNRKKISAWPILILTAALIAVRIGYLYLVHFPLSGSLGYFDIDQWQQVALLVIPILSWIVVNYALTSISDGKQTLRETLLSSIYAFLPYILLTLPMGLISHLLSAEEAVVYNAAINLIMVWSVLLLLLSNKIQNEYSFQKMTGMVLKTLFGILCLWMVLVLFYVVVYQSLEFFKNVYTEFNLILNQ